MPNSIVLDAALRYVAHGRSVLYIEPGTKFPRNIKGGWKQYQNTAATQRQLRSWFQGKQRGLCIITGYGSGWTDQDGTVHGKEIIDFDDPGLYEDWCQEAYRIGLGDLIARLPAETTPSDGAHIGYLCATIEGNKKLAMRNVTAAELAANPGEKTKARIETRGEGGLCVVAPTPPGIHPEKPENGYVMIRGSWADVPMITPEERQQLLALSRSYQTSTLTPNDAAAQANGAKPGTPRQSGALDPAKPGDDLNMRADRAWWKALVEPYGWKHLRTRASDDVEMWQRPGKEGPDASATLGATGSGFYVFSSNAAPIEGQRIYNPFSAYIRLEHGGDEKAATKALGKLGYGTSKEEWTKDKKREKTAVNFSEQAIKEQNTNGTAESAVGIDDDEDIKLQLTKDGKVRENLVNYAAILGEHPDWKGRLVFDEFTGTVLLDNDALTDEIVTEIGIQIGKTFEIGGNNANVRALAIKAVAKHNPRDLLQKYLSGLPAWDKEPRLFSWLRHWAGAENDDYSSWVGGMTIIQMMARGISPGTIARYVTILEGQEGTGKSALVRTLGAPWSIDFDMSMDSKEAHMLIQGRWVAEISELSAVSRSQEARVKSFLSQTSDDYVPKYSNNTISRPRRTVFIGTTNDQAQYLLGQTGNTRFLPVRTGAIDLKAIASNREQLFAEALLFYQDRPEEWWKPPPGLQEILQEEREDRRASHAWEEPIQKWLGSDRKYVTLSDVMELALGIRKEDWPRHQKGAGQVMRTLGWKYGRTSTEGKGGKRDWTRRWRRPEKDEGLTI